MKTCIGFLLFILCCLEGYSEIYDWNIKAVEDKPNFGEDFKVLRSAMRNDMQKELTKSIRTPGKSTLKAPSNIDGHSSFNALKSSLQSFNTNIQNRGNRNGHGQHRKITKPCKYGGDDEMDIQCFHKDDDENEDDELDELDTFELLPSSDAKNNENFLGTNLFGNVRKRCFSMEDIALLSARRDFENLIPKELPDSLLSDRFVTILMKYFYNIHEMISGISNEESRTVAQKAFYDTLGGYLNYYLMPISKYSYYAGQVSLQTVENVISLHRNCKKYLNVNGNAWRAPIKDVLRKLKSVHIEPLHMDESRGCSEASFCLHLDMNSDQVHYDKEKMIVPLPNLDPEDHNNFLNNIWIPFKDKQTYDLRSDSSAYVLVKFYETVSKCYQYQHIDQNCFNNKFRNWLLENIHVHMNDEQFYPGLGAILRIYEILKYGKKYTRHDKQHASEEDEDFDYKNADVNPEEDSGSYMVGSGSHALVGRSRILENEDSTALVDSAQQKAANVSQVIKANDMKNNPGKLALSKANETNGVDLATQDIAKKLEKIIIKVENATAGVAENSTANLTLFQRMANKMATLTKIDPITNSRGIFDFSRSDTILVWLLLLLFAAIPIFAVYSVIDDKKSVGKRVRLSIEKRKSRKRAGDETKDEIVSQTANLVRKQPEEEEILLRSDSKSVLPVTVHPVIEKSPETLEVKRTKLPSIIDTTSLDYTSSDVEDKLAEKFKRLKKKMKTCIGVLIIVLLWPGIASAYNWNFTAYPHFSGFTDSLNFQAALDNEMQMDLLKKPPMLGIDTGVPSVTRTLYSPTLEATMRYVSPYSHNQNYDDSNIYHNTINDKRVKEENDEDDREPCQECDNSKGSKKIVSEPYFVGTNLFGSARNKCFSTEDVALLTARRDFENLIPKDLPQCLLNDRMVSVLVNYFHACHETISRMAMDASKRLAERAFHDALGGYLNYYLVPVTKFSFYAGQVSLETVENVLQMLKQCKQFLNVNGNGWKSPMKDVLKELKAVHIEPLHIDEQAKNGDPSFCLRLDMNTEPSESEEGDMIVALPKLEPEDRNDLLGNIRLPFKHKRSFDLRAESSAYIVVKFYETITKCYQCKHVNQDCFNAKFRTWIVENIQVHLSDEQFYPGLGAILRISENLKVGKRDNLYGDNLVDKDVDYAEVKQKRNKESHKLYKPIFFDDETREFLDNLTKSKLLNENTKKLIENSHGTQAKYRSRAHKQRPHHQNAASDHRLIPVNSLNMSPGISPLINSSSKLSSSSSNLDQSNSNPNTNIMNTVYKEISRLADLTNQNLSKTQLDVSNVTAPVSNGFLRLDPSELSTPQAVIILTIPVVLFLMVVIICIKKGKRKKSPKLPLESGGGGGSGAAADVMMKRLRYQSHPAVPVGSSSSVMSLSSEILCQPKPKTLPFNAKRPGGVLETTSMDYTSSDTARGDKKKGKPTPSASTDKSAKSTAKPAAAKPAGKK
uniref:Uncharacterized protein n=1 Tax=Glossina morsitans morsitans TaxID=37546 RepID=A0A1B0FB12_GLOMM